jgi:hypothetical protein
VVVTCAQGELVAGRRLWIVRHDGPEERQNSRSVLQQKAAFDRRGKCEVTLDAGTYRFDVLARDGSTVVALTTGATEIRRDTELELQAQEARPLSVSYQGRKLVLDRATFRVEGCLEKVEWSRSSASAAAGPSVVLSPDQYFRARLIGNRRGADEQVHVILWVKLTPSDLALNVPRREGWLSRTRLKWQGDKAGRRKIARATARLYFPENDHLDVPIGAATLLVTNRRFIEMSYGYETTPGKHVEFNRRSHVLSPAHTIGWGGPLKLSAYARVTMKWAKPGRSLLWGAYLHNGAGDVVSLNEFPPEKPHKRTAEDYPSYLNFRQRFSDIQWKQTLHRIDGQHVPADAENLTERDLDKIDDVNRMHENYFVAVSHVLDGQQVHENVPLAKFVTWRSKHVSIEAPATWGGRPAACLDRIERVFAICRPLGRYTPGSIQMFWTNNYGAGYAIGSRANKRVQMGFFNLRDRKCLYSLPYILIHEILHTFGYSHGREHDQAIAKATRIYHNHRAFLADNPGYTPEAIALDRSVEDARNFGAENHGKFARVRVARARKRRPVHLGAFRGHKPNVQTPREALKEVLALKDKDPRPATWGKGTVDLLEGVDQAKAVMHGKWTKLDGQMVSSETPYARFQLPAAPRGSYLLEVQFTRVSGDCVAAMLPVGDAAVVLVVSGWGGKVSGLTSVNGKDADRNSTTRNGELANGAKHTLLVEVLLRDRGQARINVTLDGKSYITWQGPRSGLSLDRAWRLRQRGALGLGAYDSVVVFHSCRLKPVDAKASAKQ